ncbi:MAG: S46 family peptidase [Gemmatimonadales bacterium]|jgi:hypothetical protein
MIRIRSRPTRRLGTAATVAAAAAALFAFAPTASAQVAGVDLDTVRMGRFDYGKMWTFEYPPKEYFSETYGFDANDAWFERARLSALRIPGCSASFISPHGLLITNHHCVRGRLASVNRDGESLLDNGFFAKNLADERQIPNYYADQLIAAVDVSDEFLDALDAAADEAGRDAALERVTGDVTQRLLAEHPMGEDSVWVQIVPLYNGGRYSAYVFRRFTDIRLVAAVELNMGFFGGDPDNFTYPRYALDFAFLRVYGRDGEPYEPDNYFTLGHGVEEGDPVFIIGNPGSTNRLQTVAQLEYQRDVQVPALIHLLKSRHDAMGAYRRAFPEEAERLDMRNRMFGLSNSLKASEGRLAALGDPVILARKADADRQLREAIMADPELAGRYADLFDEIADVQQGKRALADPFGAFLAFGSSFLESGVLRRALAARAYVTAREAGAAEDQMAQLARNLTNVSNFPADLERRLLIERLADFQRYLPEEELSQIGLVGRSAAEAADALLTGSRLADASSATAIIEGGEDLADDAGMRLAAAIAPAAEAYGERSQPLARREADLEQQLGRARFAVYGRSVPPDGTSSPRIADGVVRGYSYNGTLAPPHTTFYGIYDRFYSHGDNEDWQLPPRWVTPPAGLDLSTPLNFVSTTDSYGGNSGSPAVTPDLEVVGLNFDRNIEGLSRDFIYLPERGRNVMVDVRAIREALDVAYDLDRILMEAETGRLFRTEAEADRARSSE